MKNLTSGLRPARAGTIARRAIARARGSEHGRGLGRQDFDFLEALDVLAVERVAERALEPRKVDPLLLRHQAYRFARLAHPGGAADAMNVAFGFVGKLEIAH